MRPAISASRRRLVESTARKASQHRKTSNICIFCHQQPLQTRPSVQHQRSPGRSFHSTPSTSQESTTPQTHYDLFPTSVPQGPPPHGPFSVDLSSLKREFLQIQATAHPDRHPQPMKAKAEALSARVNEAYKTLSDPLLRAQYILSLKGIDVAEDETAKVEDPGLLMAVLDAREVIEDAQQESELEEVKARNDKNIKESLDDLEEAFQKDDMDVAKREAVRLRYWINIKQSIDDWEPGKPVILHH